MRGLPGSFVTRRMRSSWLLLAGVAVTVLITATLTAALASFGSAGLPLAVHQQLDRSAAARTSCPAASSSGWPSPVPWPAAPGC
jgi:hypothetical protein